LGRNQDTDIKVGDISVSRNHCRIQYKNGSFFLIDTFSKYGTLAMVRDPLEIGLGSKHAV